MFLQLEKRFLEVFSSLLKKEQLFADTFAVGVSGGADSLALVSLLKSFSEVYPCKIVALTVNHQLRVDSLEEAEYVATLMNKQGIEHHILTWTGEKPKSGIEEAARKARYALLREFCEQNSIQNLLVAHHKMDQAETVLMRLQRGSGVDGLSGMAEVSEFENLKLVRPLLGFMPEELKIYLQEKKVEWKDDSLNECEDFLRVRVRKFLPEMEEKIGLSVDRLAKTAMVLSRTRDYLEKQTDAFVKNHVKFLEQKVLKISVTQLQNLHEEILFRVLAKLLKNVAERDYIPEAEQVQRICDSIMNGEKQSRTLASCEIIFQDKSLWIIPEIKDKTIIKREELELFIEQTFKKNILPYRVKKYLFMKSIEF